MNQSGSWFLLQTWLTEAYESRNTPLLVEILELLQLCPMSEARLKDNDVTQIIQSIAQEYNDQSKLPLIFYSCHAVVIEVCNSIVNDNQRKETRLKNRLNTDGMTLFEIDCRHLATQLWSRWFTPAKSSTAAANEFMMDGQGSMLPVPEDMDLSIYAPDTSTSATATNVLFNYTDSINMNLTEEMNVGMSMNTLTTLDMNSYAPYMENNDYYAMNSVVEPLAINSNIIDNAISHENYMQSNYSNETMNDEQPLLNPQPQIQNTHPSSVAVDNWSADTTVPSTSTSTSTTSTTLPTNTTAPTTPTLEPVKAVEVSPASGLPVLKIKVTKGGQPYVVSSTSSQSQSQSQLESKVDDSDTSESTRDKDKSTKDKTKDKKKDKDRDKKASSSSSKTSSSGSSRDESKKSDSSKKRDKDKDKDKDRSSSSKSDKLSKDKLKSKASKDDKNDKRVKSSPRTESQVKEAKQLKQAEKNRETLALLQARTPSAVKMPKIPRKKLEDQQDASWDAAPATTAATTAATDVLDKLQRPKTVKMFNSKFRSTGLEEGSKQLTVKKPGSCSPSSLLDVKKVATASVKRSAAPYDAALGPLDKKSKPIDDSAISAAVAAVMKKTAADTKPAVKLISPRPRRKLSFSSITFVFIYSFIEFLHFFFFCGTVFPSLMNLFHVQLPYEIP